MLKEKKVNKSVESAGQLEKDLEVKNLQLAKFKKAIPKVIFVIIICIFVMPYYPHWKIEKGLDEKGYWGTVIWGALILLVVVPIALYMQYLNIQSEISELKSKIQKTKLK